MFIPKNPRLLIILTNPKLQNPPPNPVLCLRLNNCFINKNPFLFVDYDLSRFIDRRNLYVYAFNSHFSSA